MVDIYHAAARTYMANPHIMKTIQSQSSSNEDALLVVDCLQHFPESEWVPMLGAEFRTWGKSRIVRTLREFPHVYRILLFWRLSLCEPSGLPIEEWKSEYALKLIVKCLHNTVRGLACGIEKAPTTVSRSFIGADSNWYITAPSTTVIRSGPCGQPLRVYHTPTKLSQKLPLKKGSIIRPHGKIYASTDPLWTWPPFVTPGDCVRFDIDLPAWFPFYVMDRYQTGRNLQPGRTNKTIILHAVLSYEVVELGREVGHRFYRLLPLVEILRPDASMGAS